MVFVHSCFVKNYNKKKSTSVALKQCHYYHKNRLAVETSAATIYRYIDISQHNSFATRSIELLRISTYAQSIIIGDVPAAHAATKECYFSRRSMSVDCGDFEKLVAKPKCKSKVWKHFGLPADAHSEIMDKKIVSRLCKAT